MDISSGGDLGCFAVYFGVVVFLSDLPLMACRAVSVSVELYLPPAPSFTPGMARVFHQVVIFVLIVVRGFEGGQTVGVGGGRHEEREKSRSSSSRQDSREQVNR